MAIAKSWLELLKRGVISIGEAIVSSWAPKFDGVSTYIAFPTEYLFEGDYVIEVDVYFTEGDTIRLWGNTSAFFSRAMVLGDGSISFRAGEASSATAAPSGSVSEGWSTIKVTRYSGQNTIYVNDVVVAQNSYTVVTTKITVVGRQQSYYGSGIIRNMNINGEIWPFNERFSEYPSLTSKLGNIATAYNFTEEDVVEAV